MVRTMYWFEFPNDSQAERFRILALEGYFGPSMAAQISPLNRCSVDVNFRNYRYDPALVAHIPNLQKWGEFKRLIESELSQEIVRGLDASELKDSGPDALYG